MNPDEFPDTAAQLPPLEADNQLHVLSPEETAPPPTPAQEIGVVDGEFQVYRNPAEGETEGHFETGWTVAKSFDVPVEDGSTIPALMLEKVFDTGRFDENGEKVFVISKKPIQLEVFRSWQQPELIESTKLVTETELPHVLEGSAAESMAKTLHELTVAEELGETAVEISGAELVELPKEDEASAAELSQDAEAAVDMVSIFKDGQSLEGALEDPSLSPEARHDIEAVALQWKATHGAVEVIKQVWGEDLKPALQRLLDEATQTARSTQGLLQRTDEISRSLDLLSTAREYNDVSTERQIVSQLQLDIAVPDIRRKAVQYADADESMPTGRRVRAEAETAFEAVNHARHDKRVTPEDFEAIAAHVRPMLQAGATLAAVTAGMYDETQDVIRHWNNTEHLVEEAGIAFNMLKSDTMASDALASLARQLETLQYEPQHSDVSSMRVAARHALDGLQHYQQRAWLIANVGEEASQRSF